MDPNKALENALNDMKEARNPDFSFARRFEHKVAAAQALHDLAEWLEGGGFAPEYAKTALEAVGFHAKKVRADIYRQKCLQKRQNSANFEK